MRTMTIDVTAEDIQDSTRSGCGSGGNCPVWRAVHRALPGVPGLWVTRNQILAHIRTVEPPVIAWLPPAATTFIDLYDSKKAFDSLMPFSFSIEVSDEYRAEVPADV